MLRLYKIIIANAIILLGFSNNVHSQYCGAATTSGSISPNSTVQYTGAYGSGFISLSFGATAGCTYTFSTCGLSSADTYLRIYSNASGGTELAGADDQCGLQSNLVWTCTSSGTYSLLLSNWPCNSLSSSTQIAYSQSCVTENMIPTSGNNAYTLCSGSLYDHGGSAGGYANSISGYTTIYPSIGGNVVQLSGTMDTEAGYDFVRIYDGVGLGGTLLYSNSGNANIGTITSLSGPITVQFTTDGSVTYTGFAFNIACIVPVPASPTSITAGSTSFCGSGTTTLTANGAVGTVYWFTGGCNTTGQIGTGNSISVSPTTTTTYYARNFNGGQWSTSCASVTITINPVPTITASSASPSSICGGGTSNINATSAGNTINWYSAATGGTLLGTSASGANLAVSPSSTTTYYAEAVGASSGSTTFSYTGGAQTFTVPAGVTSLTFDIQGAQGGSNATYGAGGLGGRIQGTYAVTPGQVLTIYVGGTTTTATGGFNGGGNSGNITYGTGGGGASDIRIGGTALANRVLVAGGGGGNGTNCWSAINMGGAGGGLTGGDGYECSNLGSIYTGKGGNQVAGGAYGNDLSQGCGGAGSLGQGGNGSCTYGGGAGGGYYGGGGGGYGGAGGGSNFAGSASGVTHTQGFKSGNGLVTLTWTGSGCVSASRTAVAVTVNSAPSATLTTSSSTVCNGTQVSLGGNITATGAWTLTMSNGQTATGTGNGTWSINATPTGTTTYSIASLTDASSCPSLISGSSTITLPTAGSNLGNNNETATCVVNQNGWIHFYHSSGRLLASVNSLGQNLGNVTVTSYVDVTNASVPACTNPNPIYNTSVMQRHWVITPTIQPTTPVQVRFPYSNSEFSSLTGVSTVNANPNDDVFVPGDVKLNKYSGPLNVNSNPLDNCPGTGGSGGTTQHDPIANGVATVYSTVGSAYYSDFSIPGFSEFWLNGNLTASPLPVELTSFQANCTDDQKVEITWTTASEHNSSHFVVEKTLDGQEWSQLATIQSAGNSNSLLTYSIIDQDRSIETVYYRLIQVDIDGQAKMYDPISINCGDLSEGNSIRTYPNPSNSDFHVEVISSKEVENATIKMLDSHGALLMSIDVKLNKGLTLINMENNTFAPGVYYIVIENEQVLFEKSKHIIH